MNINVSSQTEEKGTVRNSSRSGAVQPVRTRARSWTGGQWVDRVTREHNGTKQGLAAVVPAANTE